MENMQKYDQRERKTADVEELQIRQKCLQTDVPPKSNLLFLFSSLDVLTVVLVSQPLDPDEYLSAFFPFMSCHCDWKLVAVRVGA